MAPALRSETTPPEPSLSRKRDIIPHHGPVVAQADLTKVVQIYELRSLLEGLPAKDAAIQASEADIAALDDALDKVRLGYARGDPAQVPGATSRFYEILFLSAGKTVAWDLLKALNVRISHLGAITISIAGRAKDGPAEMKAIVDAIRRHASGEAYQASLRHVENAARIAGGFPKPINNICNQEAAHFFA